MADHHEHSRGREITMNPTVQKLIAMAEEELGSVELLLDQNYIRAALSRCYFAMFYMAEAILLSEGKSYSSHRAVISALGKNFVRAGKFPKQLHQYLVRAQERRLSADYTAPGDLTLEDARKQFEWAKQFLSEARSYLVGENP